MEKMEKMEKSMEKKYGEYKKAIENYDIALPSYPVSYTEEEKEAQRLRGDELARFAAEAARERKRSLAIEPGVYRIREGLVAFDYRGVKNLAIDMSGADIIVDGLLPLMELTDCEDVTVSGPMTMDRDPLPFVQFEILEYSAAKEEMKVRFMEGYDMRTVRQDATYLFFEKSGKRIPHCFIGSESFELTDPENRIGLYRSVPCLSHMGSERALRPGVVGATNVKGGYTRTVQLNNCSRFAMSDITQYSCGVLLNEKAGHGPDRYTRIRNIRRPGTNRLSGGCLGQLVYDEGGLVLEESIISFTDDDAIDVMSFSHMVWKQESPHTVVIKPINRKIPVKAGDALRFFDGDSFDLRGEGKAKSFEVIDDPAMEAAARKAAREKYEYIAVHEVPCVRVELDSAVTVKEGDCMENLTSFRPSGVIIRDNYFHDIFCRILIHGSKGILVENNLVERTGLAAIDIDHEQAAWAEGANSEDVAIRNNIIRDSPFSPYVNSGRDRTHSGAISVGVSQRARCFPSRDSSSFSNIAIEGNKICNPMYAGILVKNANNVKIKGNRIENACTKLGTPVKDRDPAEEYYGEQFSSGIFLFSCSEIELEGNAVTPGQFCKQDARKLYCK
jgi:hypothetical protein